MRARNIKPGFYRDADLSECSVEARYIVPGLWMMADREGRLKDSPKQIKMELFPCDPWDVEALLCELAKVRHIIRYEVDGLRLIQIKNFRKWVGRDLPPNWRDLRQAVFERDNYICSYCGRKTDVPHCDHIVPHNKGGSNEMNNLTTSCPACNLSKHAKTPSEWRESLEISQH
jgi:hypothetical protein